MTLFSPGEQWDYPNGWAPLQHLIVDALDKSGEPEARTLAFEIAENWIMGNYKTYIQANKTMFEKVWAQSSNSFYW
jgi:alpha,alpha-trehalase